MSDRYIIAAHAARRHLATAIGSLAVVLLLLLLLATVTT